MSANTEQRVIKKGIPVLFSSPLLDEELPTILEPGDPYYTMFKKPGVRRFTADNGVVIERTK